MSFANVGKVWIRESFRAYLKTVTNSHGFTGVTVHHCAEPSLAQRPQGLKPQHIHNMADFYREKGWSSGPHLFTDEDQVFGMCPLTERGIHAVSFNGSDIGVEMLGDYDDEDPKSGRGLAVVTLTAGIVADLLEWMGKKPTGREVCGRVCVPLGMFLMARGVSSDEVAAKLRKEGDTFYFGTDDLDGAYFDKAVGATMVPIRELLPIVGRKVDSFDPEALAVTLSKA
jgi:N-acetylmuramoyl-L-alanine amidase